MDMHGGSVHVWEFKADKLIITAKWNIQENNDDCKDHTYKLQIDHKLLFTKHKRVSVN